MQEIHHPIVSRRTTPDGTGVLAVALLARLLVLWNVLSTHPHTWFFSRGIEMGLLADSLLHGHGYSSPFGGYTGPTAFIAPGYPTLVAAVFAIFGTYSYASAIVLMGLQIAVALVTIWLIMRVTVTIAPPALAQPAARVAGLFWALSPPLLFIPTIFWETSFSACALLGMLALTLDSRRVPRRSRWLLLGALCGLIGLINPALLPALLALLAWLAVTTRSMTQVRPLAWPIGALGVMALIFAPWPIRNAVRFHAFIPTRTTVGFELWMGNRPGATGFLDESLFPMYNPQELALYNSQGELAYTAAKSAEAKAYIVAHPGVFLRMSLLRCFRFWTGTGNLKGSPAYVLHACLTTLFGFAGLLLLYRRSRTIAILFALPLLLFPLPYCITHAEFRYRLNIDPLLTVLAAAAVVELAASRGATERESAGGVVTEVRSRSSSTATPSS